MSLEACVACGAQNPDDALFCGSCGTRLGRECSACGAVVAAGLAYCTSCGAALEEAPPPPVAEERKIVSVLFADLVGFTARAEELDPEDVRGMLAPFHGLAKTELERFGGTMEKFIGDAAVAFYGAPVAHEDDPERAVRAALALRDAAGGLNASVRIGVTTGEALVTRAARPLEGEGMAAGDVVNTAARLQVAAPANGVLVDEATYRATEQVIEYREHDAVSAKGKTDPVTVWEAVAPRARLGVDIAFRGGAALVGRQGELQALRDALGRATRERTVQLVTLVGVPGIGKSRLVYELWAALEAEPDLVYWRQGRSLPYGDGVSFWALGEMTKAHAGILESDDARAAEEKLTSAVAHAVPDAAEARWIEGHLRPLVGLGGDPGSAERRGEAFAAWRRFFESLADQRPVLLVFEDLHWADDGLLDFVDHLAGWATDVPLLVVCTARPELLERRPDWGGGKRNSLTVSLGPLSDEQAELLLADLVGVLDPELLARAGGNPLYAEEYARMRAQRDDGGELPLPDSVHGIIAARLDLLPPEEKSVVQDAAVLGKVFWHGELAHVAGLGASAFEERLRALERKEFVRRERRSSVAGETAYVFRHVLVRDVAYGQIPRPRRAEKHRLAAEWIESLAGDRREDLADVVAHHYLSALELARAAGAEDGDLAERARGALRSAGDRAARLNAFAEAARFYGAALDLWPADDAERPGLLFALGRSLFYSEDTGAELLAQAAEELLDAGDVERSVQAQTIVGELAWIGGEREDAFAHFRGAAHLLAEAEASPAKAHTLAILARFLMAADEYEEAARIGSEALRMADELGVNELRVTLLNTLGVSRVGTGDLGGVADLEASIELAERLNSPDAMRAYNNLASTLAALGQLERSFELYGQALEAARRFGRPLAAGWIRSEQADEQYFRGHWDEALALCEDVLADSLGGERYLFHVGARVVRALIHVARGDLSGAEEESAQAVAFGREVRDPQHLFPALAARSFVLAEVGDSTAAAPVVDELLESWRARPNTFAASWIANLAPAAFACGRAGQLANAAGAATVRTRWLDAALAFVRGDFAEAAVLYAAIGSQPDEALARLRAAEHLVRAERRAEAEDELGQALDFYRRAGAGRFVREGETLLALT